MITGSIVALATPMHDNGDVDWENSIVQSQFFQGNRNFIAVWRAPSVKIDHGMLSFVSAGVAA